MSEHLQPSIDRRQFLRQGAAGMGAAAILDSAVAQSRAAEQGRKPVRIGVIGVGPRGQWHVTNLLANHPDVTIPAICDIKEDRLAAAIAMVKKRRGTAPAGYPKGVYDYRNLCARDDLDAVLIAGPVQWIGPMTIDALKAGKHVGHEVSGVQTEDECWAMVQEKEKSG